MYTIIDKSRHMPGSQAKKDGKNFISFIFLNNWIDYRKDPQPMDRRMQILSKAGVQGMGSENIRFLISQLLRKLPPKAVYLEIGTYHGASLLSAAVFNPSKRCIGIDNFSQFGRFSIVKATAGLYPFDERKDSFSRLKENLAKFHHPKNIQFLKGDFKRCLNWLFEKEPKLKISFFFYDGDHSYESQSLAMRMVKPHLAKNCIILVDDVNEKGPQRANEEFLQENSDFKLIKLIHTPRNEYETWWNGIAVMARGYR